ncbi:MFS transporter [Streptomyces sp. NPDC004647]|uniref:MFS transporter n=1 Tax=Streptomyces sp. NPDC004647 TaxID=3154671 RepID=UPI0033A03236
MTGPRPAPASRSAVRERWDARRRILLAVLSGNMLLDAVEVSVVLIALPTIADRLGLSPLAAQWLMSGFALGFAALLPLGPALAGRVGRRPVYLGAMLLFGLASVVGGLADSLAVLVVIRLLKGACAALTAPAGLAIISDIFPDGPQRRRALAVYSFFGAGGFTSGLLLGGALLEAGWRWVFVFPAPVALVLFLGGMRVLPRNQGGARPGLPRPALLREGSLLGSALGAASLNGTYQSLLLVMVFQSVGGFGWAPWCTALALLPACVPLAVTIPFAGRLIARYGGGRLITLGALFPLLGYGLYLARPEGSPYVQGMLPALLLVEAGFCCSFVALNMRATASLAPADRGAAVSLYQMCVQLGAAVLLPLVALLLTHGDGPRPALTLITAAGALGLLVPLAVRRVSARSSPGPDPRAPGGPAPYPSRTPPQGDVPHG